MPNDHTHSDGLTRREFVGVGAAAAAIFGAGPLSKGMVRAAHARTSRPEGTPKNVILLISDGMSPGVLQMADHFARLGEGEDYFKTDPSNSATHWGRLTHDPSSRTTLMSTSSANGPVTDSAAAGTAFSVGARTNNGMLCVLPDGARPLPLAQRVKASGRATGLVSTTHLTHATPAAFLVNHADRHDYPPIAVQMLAKHADVMLGGGSRYFTDARIRTHAPHMHVVRTSKDLAKGLPDDAPALGLFQREHMRYELDRTEEEPSLVDMTRAALGRLAQDPAGFFLMVEGGRIDHAAHANDSAALLHDQLAFDEALGAALAFARQRDDTLIIVTSDHGNANPGITHYASRGAERFATLRNATASFERMYQDMGDSPSLASVVRVIEATHRVTLRDSERAMLERAMADEPVNAFRPSDSLAGAMGAVLANHSSVAFCSPNHTSDHVVLSALGPMSDRLPALGHIVDLHALLVSALALD